MKRNGLCAAWQHLGVAGVDDTARWEDLKLLPPPATQLMNRRMPTGTSGGVGGRGPYGPYLPDSRSVMFWPKSSRGRQRLP